MSLRALKAAFAAIATHKMAAPSRLVLLALANRHNQETGRCDPSTARLASDVQIDERTVRKSLRELEALGLLQTVHRQARTGRGKRNMRNRYRILVGANGPVVVGANNPPNQEDNTPSSFRDLAMLLDDGDDRA
jgi:hypothetical protein